jgi:hypothetical protein
MVECSSMHWHFEVGTGGHRVALRSCDHRYRDHSHHHVLFNRTRLRGRTQSYSPHRRRGRILDK